MARAGATSQEHRAFKCRLPQSHTATKRSSEIAQPGIHRAARTGKLLAKRVDLECWMDAALFSQTQSKKGETACPPALHAYKFDEEWRKS